MYAARKSRQNLTSAQQHYRQDYDQQVRLADTFQLGDWLYIGLPPLATTSDTAASQTALSAFNKLIPRHLRPFGLIAVCPHIILTHKHSIGNVDSTDRATRAPHPRRSETTDHRHQPGEKNRKAHQQSAQWDLETAKAKWTRHGNGMLKYIVDKIVQHVGTDASYQYSIGCYKYSAQNNTTDPPDYPPDY